MKQLAILLLCPIVLSVPATLLAQAEKAAIKTFKKHFKPRAKTLEGALQGMAGYETDSLEYRRALDRRDSALDEWGKAVRALEGHSSPAVGKLLADAWVRIDKEVNLLLVRRRKLDQRINKSYEKMVKMAGGRAVQPGKNYSGAVMAAQQTWLLLCRRAAQIERDMRSLIRLQDKLRVTVSKMSAAPGPVWMLNHVVGSKQHDLALKVEVIRAVARFGASTAAAMITALQAAKKPDELAALALGTGILGEAAKPAVPRLVELMRHEDPGVREQAAIALKNLRAPNSIEPMIEVLAMATGRSRNRIAEALQTLTAQTHGTNVSAWKKWFAASGAKYASGEAPLGKGWPEVPKRLAKDNTFYGIPQDGGSIVYVIDCSISMTVDRDNPKWEPDPRYRARVVPVPASAGKTSRHKAARDELTRALDMLRRDTRFNIVAYNHASTLYKETMVLATPENIREAQKWVQGLVADSTANTYDALQMAFTLAEGDAYDKTYGVQFDTIYLLTDSHPSLQGLGDDDPRSILVGVRRWNPLKRVVIHCVAMGNDMKSYFLSALSNLAHENGGRIKHVHR